MCNGITYYLQNIQLIIPGGRDCAARVCHVRPVGDSGGAARPRPRPRPRRTSSNTWWRTRERGEFCQREERLSGEDGEEVPEGQHRDGAAEDYQGHHDQEGHCQVVTAITMLSSTPRVLSCDQRVIYVGVKLVK